MKRLSFRFVRRCFLILALVFPVLYLFGSFVAGLAGSHGNVTFAQEDDVVTDSYVVDFNQRVALASTITTSGITYTNNHDGSLTLSGTASGQSFFGLSRLPISLKAQHKYLFATMAPVSNNSVYCYVSSPYVVLTNKYMIYTANNDYSSIYFACTVASGYSFADPFTFYPMIFDLTQMFGFGNEPTVSNFLAMYPDDFYSYTLSRSEIVELRDTPTYSEFVFNQILGNDNIIKQWGYYALSEGDKGFAPFRDLVSFIDDTFFHFGTSNDLALFVYGYVYYALNIVAIYELVALVVMVFTIPLKLTDRFTKEM